MITFRQKNFFLPALVGSAGLGNVLTGGMIIQGVGQAREAKEQSEAQQEQMEKQNELIAQQNKQLELLSKQAQNAPGLGEQAAMIKQNQFAAVPGKLGFFDSLVTTGKDIKNLVWDSRNNLAKLTIGGVGMGIAGYGANKWIQHDMKENNLESVMMPNSNQNNSGYQQRQMSESVMAAGEKAAQNQSILSRTTNFIKRNAKEELGSKTGIGMAAGFGAGIPIYSYLSEKKKVMAQMNGGNDGERQYSSTESVFQKNYSGPGILHKALNGVASVFGGMGNKAIVNAAGKLNKSKSGFSNAIGNALIKTGPDGKPIATNMALAGATGLGFGIMDLTWGAGEKAVKKVGETIDPGAYKYSNYKESEVAQ